MYIGIAPPSLNSNIGLIKIIIILTDVIQICIGNIYLIIILTFQCKKWCKELDNSVVSDGLKEWLQQDNIKIESSSAAAAAAAAAAMKQEDSTEKEFQQVPDVASSNDSFE